MLTLQEVFDTLTSAELSQLSIGGQPMGTINTSNVRRVLPHVQGGLTALYTRFQLKEGQLWLVLRPNISIYQLSNRYLSRTADSVDEVRNLRNSDHGADFRFRNDILKVEAVLTESGLELPLNDATYAYNVRLVDLRTLVLPRELVEPETIARVISTDVEPQIGGDRLEIRYRANHPHLSRLGAAYEPGQVAEEAGGADFSDITLELPDAYLEPLCYYVAARLHNPVGMTNEFHSGNNYFQKFELACQQLETANVELDTIRTHDRLRDRGFV
jgi:hypothetical protein